MHLGSTKRHFYLVDRATFEISVDKDRQQQEACVLGVDDVPL